MIKLLKASTAVIVVAGALLATGQVAVAADAVVARVYGTEIKNSQVRDDMKALPDDLKKVPEATLFALLRDRLVDQMLLKRAVTDAKTADKEDVKKAIEKMTEQMVIQSYLLEKVKAAVTPEAVQKKYDEIIKKFPNEKETHARHILLKDEGTAKAVIKALKNGADFAKLAAEKTIDPSGKASGGDLGYFMRGGMAKEFADAAFEMKVGSVSETPVKTEFGYHVIKVEDRRDAKPPKFEDAKGELETAMTQEVYFKTLKALRDAAGKSLERFDEAGKPVVDEKPKAAEATPAPATSAVPAPVKK